MTEGILLLRHRDVPGLQDINVYRELGGWRAWPKAIQEMTPDEAVDVVFRSGLRGRGGAYFPTGRKWSLTVRDGGPNYICCNADEGEPGTFHDRELMQTNPHQLLEGCAIAAYANAAETVYIYIRHEFPKPARVLGRAIEQAYGAGYFGDDVLGTGRRLNISVYRGAGAYICGEETSLLSSIDGTRALPRVRPPYPGQRGIFGRPTVVNNVQTLCNVPHIINNGPEWFRQWGTEPAPGTLVVAVSGHVNNPGNHEVEMGTPLRRVIHEWAGGVPGGHHIKAIIPGGSSTPYLTADRLDVHMDPESVAAAGSMLGSAAVVVMDDTTCIVSVTRRLVQFYMHESCGQCTPCREGCGWLHRLLCAIERGEADLGALDLLEDVCRGMDGKCLCLLGDSATYPVMSSLRHFRGEYEHHIRTGLCGGWEPPRSGNGGS